MLTKKVIGQCKYVYESIRDYPDNSEYIDADLLPVLNELNSKDGLCSIFSCYGHYKKNKSNLAQSFWHISSPYLVIGYHRNTHGKIKKMMKEFQKELPTSITNYMRIGYWTPPHLNRECLEFSVQFPISESLRYSKKKDKEANELYSVLWETFLAKVKKI